MPVEWKRFRYKADALAFIQANNLPKHRLSGTNGNWVVAYSKEELIKH